MVGYSQLPPLSYAFDFRFALLFSHSLQSGAWNRLFGLSSPLNMLKVKERKTAPVCQLGFIFCVEGLLRLIMARQVGQIEVLFTFTDEAYLYQ